MNWMGPSRSSLLLLSISLLSASAFAQSSQFQETCNYSATTSPSAFTTGSSSGGPSCSASNNSPSTLTLLGNATQTSGPLTVTAPSTVGAAGGVFAVAVSFNATVGGTYSGTFGWGYSGGGSQKQLLLNISVAYPGPFVTGYISPKYVIVGLTYAPPGPSSSVTYLTSTAVSVTNSVGSSFTNAFMTSLTTSAKATIDGWQAGIKSTITAGYTQVSTSNNSLELDSTVSRSYSASGASNPYVGINHDYDIVWLWLNPVELFTLYTDAAGHAKSVQWNGHGVSLLDQPVPDIYPVYVGWLNGDIAMTPSQAAPLKRVWAAVETWKTGKVPAITGPGVGTDFANIEKIDPYWSCSTPTPTTCPTTVDPARFTLTPNNADFLYLQAPVGGTPIPQTYMENYTTISSQARGGSYSTIVGFAFETSLGAKAFGIEFERTLTVSDQITEQHTWDYKLNTTNTSQATLIITGPPCVVVNNNCSPAYNKSTQFDLYEDSLFGTFYLNPVN